MDWDYLIRIANFSWGELLKFTRGQILVSLVLTILSYAFYALSFPLDAETFLLKIKQAGVQGNLIFLLYAILTVLIIVFFYFFLFKAPYGLYLKVREEKVTIQIELDALKEKTKAKPIEPPEFISLLDAIKYIQDSTSFGQRMSISEVFHDIAKQANDSTRLVIKGRWINRYGDKREGATVSSYHANIEPKVIATSDYKQYGDFGLWALVQRWQNAEPEPYDKIEVNYDLLVSLKEIKKIYDDRK